ncbi:spectrin beta chain, non-erythrocytic 1 [Trichonephila clavipes]|nr:spectrin beta chain, non-erythrocytic 1 [Trichonephila clavipes]
MNVDSLRVKPQIALRQNEIKAFRESGKRILRLSGVLTKDVENSLKIIQEIHNDLDMAYEYRLKTLLQSRDLQLFLEKAKQTEHWLSEKEAFLANQDIGNVSIEITSKNRLNDSLSCKVDGRLETGKSRVEMARRLQVARK